MSRPILSQVQRHQVHGEAGWLEAKWGEEVGREATRFRRRVTGGGELQGAWSHCFGSDRPAPLRVGTVGGGRAGHSVSWSGKAVTISAIHCGLMLYSMLSNKPPRLLNLGAENNGLLFPWCCRWLGSHSAGGGLTHRLSSAGGSAGLEGPHGCQQGWSSVLSVVSQLGGLSSLCGLSSCRRLAGGSLPGNTQESDRQVPKVFKAYLGSRTLLAGLLVYYLSAGGKASPGSWGWRHGPHPQWQCPTAKRRTAIPRLITVARVLVLLPHVCSEPSGVEVFLPSLGSERPCAPCPGLRDEAGTRVWFSVSLRLHGTCQKSMGRGRDSLSFPQSLEPTEHRLVSCGGQAVRERQGSPGRQFGGEKALSIP